LKNPVSFQELLNLSAENYAYFSSKYQRKEEKMNNYELTVIVRSRDVESHKEKVKEILTKNDAVITKEDHWGTRKLAYEIDREREAFYMYMLVDANPASIDRIQKEFGLNADILRYLFVVLTDKKSA